MREEHFKTKFINATKWSTITEIASKFVTPITNMILARIISPEAFGVVATVNMVISFAEMIADAGFQKYLVQHEFKNEDKLYENANVAFWTNFIISIMLWLFIIIFRELIATSVGNPGFGNVVSISAVQLLLLSFSSIQMALYRRDFNFKTLFIIRMISAFVPIAITIPLAILGLSYWAIIIGTIVMQLLNAIILTIKSKWKPKFYYNIEILKEMLSFSIWSLIESITIWFSIWVDVFIISNSLNQYYLGIYKTSTAMVNAIMGIITSSIVPVLFSALSRLQEDDEKFNNVYLTTQKLISIFVFPFGVGMYAYSDFVTRIMLGSKWEEASYVIGIWALTSAITIIFSQFCSEVYRAKGKPKLSVLAQVLHLIVLIPACIISSRYGFLVLVYTRAWIRTQIVLVHFFIMKYALSFPVFQTIKNVMPTIISATFMGFLAFFLKQISEGFMWSFISIIICIIFYFGLLSLFPDMRNEINLIVGKLREILTKFKIGHEQI